MIGRLLKSKKGEGYIDVIIGVFIVIMVLVITLNIFTFVTMKTNMDRIAEALIETATYSGEFGEQFNKRVEELKNKYFDFEVEVGAESWYNMEYKRVQLGDTMSIVVKAHSTVSGINVIIPMDLSVARSGQSEQYWRIDDPEYDDPNFDSPDVMRYALDNDSKVFHELSCTTLTGIPKGSLSYTSMPSSDCLMFGYTACTTCAPHVCTPANGIEQFNGLHHWGICSCGEATGTEEHFWVYNESQGVYFCSGCLAYKQNDRVYCRKCTDNITTNSHSNKCAGSLPTTEQLQSQHKFEYYSTLNLAVTDVNNGTIGENADVDKENAVAGIYIDNGETYVVLLKDNSVTTRVIATSDMTINLGGHILSTDANVVIQVNSGNVVIDGRLPGSSIQKTFVGTQGALLQVLGGTCTASGGTYIYSCDTYINSSQAIVVASPGHMNITDATIVATSNTTDDNCKIRGISINSGATATITNCDIKAVGSNGIIYGVYNNGTSTITDCNIRAYSNYYKVDDSYTALSQGIINHGTMTINDCYVIGTHSGIENEGALYVNGGTYEGYGHGGIYFCGADNASYVQNATLRECDMPTDYTATSNDNNAGFYIGGDDNITVYMDNCDIYGSVQPIVMRDTDGEQNNSLYISNSTINLGSTTGIRIDNDTHKLVIGTGCNFTADNTTLPGAVTTTEEVYIHQ